MKNVLLFSEPVVGLYSQARNRSFHVVHLIDVRSQVAKGSVTGRQEDTRGQRFDAVALTNCPAHEAMAGIVHEQAGLRICVQGPLLNSDVRRRLSNAGWTVEIRRPWRPTLI